jgi:CRP/FNR family cyclic AMP-dependent transcriptional regulator
VMSPGGKQRIIALLSARDFVGEGCLSGQTHHIGTATAMVPTEVARIGKTAMMQLLGHEPALAELFTAFLLARNAELQDDLIDQLFNSCEQRLARVLLRLADFRGGNSATIPHVSQELLAERIGTTRPRVNAFMAKFRRLGYIEYTGTWKVNVALVKVLTNND